jgi:hypothetical protein
MQQQAWMAYSCSLHFADKFPYITLSIWSYSLRDMIFASIKHIHKKKRTRNNQKRGVGPDLAWLRNWATSVLGRELVAHATAAPEEDLGQNPCGSEA